MYEYLVHFKTNPLYKNINYLKKLNLLFENSSISCQIKYKASHLKGKLKFILLENNELEQLFS